MDGIGSVLSVLFALMMFILMLAAAYIATKVIGRKLTVQSGSKMIKVIDRVAVAPNKSLLIIKVTDKTMLVGMTEHNIQKLCDLDNDVIEDLSINTDTPDTNFTDVFMETLKSKIKFVKGSDHDKGDKSE